MKVEEVVYLGLGSNEGDRDANLRTALDRISELPDTRMEAVSSFIQTPAFGFEGPDFLNCCCRIVTAMGPHGLLDVLKAIEASMGRIFGAPIYDDRGVRIYSDRPIDIDILLYGDRKINDERLTVPHPHMLERDFVMTPLKEISTDKIL